MLTLDATTLFYFSLSDTYTSAKDKHHDTGLVSDWAAKVHRHAKPANISGQNTSTPALTNSRCSRIPPSTRFALTNNVKINNQLDEDDEIEIIDDGGLSDRDEIKGKEYEYAVKSPPKGKKRVTSFGLVKLEDSPKPEPGSKRLRKSTSSRKLMNDGLPKEYLEGGVWHKRVISTLFRWAGTQSNPWIISDAKLVNALERICDAYYNQTIQIAITTTSTAFRLASQRLSDGWRSVFGSSAIAVVNAFFDAHDKYCDSDDQRQGFANGALDKLRFIYRKANGDDRKKFRGLFRGPFVVQVFAAHFNVINGSKWIHGLYEGSSPPKPRAPLALAAAAVERVLTLWATGTITIAMVREAKATKKAIKLPAMTNPATAKQSARHTAFSELNWGKPTRSYLESIEKNVDDIAMEKIMDEAKEFSKAACGANDESAAGSFDPDDDRANLQDGSGSSGESGDDAPSQSD